MWCCPAAWRDPPRWKFTVFASGICRWLDCSRAGTDAVYADSSRAGTVAVHADPPQLAMPFPPRPPPPPPSTLKPKALPTPGNPRQHWAGASARGGSVAGGRGYRWGGGGGCSVRQPGSRDASRPQPGAGVCVAACWPSLRAPGVQEAGARKQTSQTHCDSLAAAVVTGAEAAELGQSVPLRRPTEATAPPRARAPPLPHVQPPFICTCQRGWNVCLKPWRAGNISAALLSGLLPGGAGRTNTVCTATCVTQVHVHRARSRTERSCFPGCCRKAASAV